MEQNNLTFYNNNNNNSDSNSNNTNEKILFHRNGKPIKDLSKFKSIRRDDSAFMDEPHTFPDTEIGNSLRGLIVEFLIKQECRNGWARKSACDDSEILLHPNETVASHMWGVAKLIMVLSKTKKFQDEMPQFNVLKAIEMGLLHDVPELITGDYTPVDAITIEEKHKKERAAMNKILSFFPKQINDLLSNIYSTYEERKCLESKFVKDCDKLDFLINAYILERQGFSGFEEFYQNTLDSGFNSDIAKEIANLLVKIRNELQEKNKLFRKKE